MATKQQHFQQAGSINQSLDRILAAVQETVAQIDHLANTYTGWRDEVTAGRMNQAFVDALDGLRVDIIPLRKACVTYRDAHQGE